MNRFLRDLALLVLSVLAAIAVLLILVNPGAEPGLAVSTSTPLIPSTTMAPSTTVAGVGEATAEAGEVNAVLSISNRTALCVGGAARFAVTLRGPGAIDPGRVAIAVGGVVGLTEIALEAGEVTTDPTSVVWTATHHFEADPTRTMVSLGVVRTDGPPLSPVELNESCS
ncbi:MAG: hypothetical protein GY713_17200 [Actinomycetia bacterium]|nr:hypothetical protein [Actinomycetes bacterium]